MRTMRIQEIRVTASRRNWVITMLLALGLLGLFACNGGAADISVSASLSPNTTTVGEAVQLSLNIKGTQSAKQVPTVQIDGAQVQYLGQSMQTTLNNTELTVTMTHRYYVVPQRTGDLVVPPIEMEIRGERYQTESLILKVVEPGQANAPEVNQGAFIEVEIPQRPVYVGEAFPVEMRVLVPTEVRWRPESMPEFSSDSFLKTPFQQPQQRVQNRNGRDYDVLVFRSILTAIKDGDVPFGELKFRIQMASPRKKNDRGSSPFGGIFDGFPFDTQPTVLQERTLVFNDGRMQVRALPTEGRPESFRGAVGRFRFGVGSNQPKIKVGEPLTMTLQIDGEGNFDRIEVPPLVHPEGWRVYPPESNVTKGDELGRRGMKTFRLPIVPEMAHRETPQFEFSYFDPETAKYVTQVSTPVPLEVQGSLPAVTKSEPALVPPPATKSAVEAPVSVSVLEQSDAAPIVREPWAPTKQFWQVQGTIAGVLAAFCLVRWIKVRRERQGPGPLLKKEALRLQSGLGKTSESATFLRDAIRVLQLRTSAQSGQVVDAIGEIEIGSVLGLDESCRKECRWLFEQYAMLRFAGTGNVVTLSEDERRRVFALLERSAK